MRYIEVKCNMNAVKVDVSGERLIVFLALHCISIFSLVCSGKTANRDRLGGVME